YSQGLALALVVMAITLLSLVIGELAPKRLALNNPERSALLLARPMQRLSRIAAPLVRLLEALTDLVLRVLGVEQAEETPVSEEEIKVIIAEATASGVFFPAEQEMLSGVIRLGDRRVGSLITPRTEIEWLDLDDPYDAQLRTVLESSHSRFPVGRGSLDEIQGVVLAKSVLAAGLLPDRERDLSKLVLEPLFVPENTSALQVLEALRKSPAPLVLVIDEYGGVQGLVTLSDLLASIINDLPLLEQSGEREIVVREDGSLLVDGMLPVDELVEQADVPLPVEGEGEYQTVGGLVMYCLGRVPAAGDRFELGGYRFEVMDMDGLRVDKVLIRRSPEQAT
ncbi:MAG: hemolysin family protein, partial [Chloroflexota bacterium]